MREGDLMIWHVLHVPWSVLTAPKRDGLLICALCHKENEGFGSLCCKLTYELTLKKRSTKFQSARVRLAVHVSNFNIANVTKNHTHPPPHIRYV